MKRQFWFIVGGNEAQNGNTPTLGVQVEDDGSYDFWSIIYLRDNMSVIHNTQCPKSTLRKKSNLIFYHVMRESVAMRESLTTHIPTNDNPLDQMTKDLAG